MSTNTKAEELAECWINPDPKHPDDWFSRFERAGWLRFVPAPVDQQAEREPLSDEQVLMISRRALDKCSDIEAQHIYVAREVERAAMLAAAPTPPAPEAQQPAGQEQDERAAFEAWFSGFRHGWKSEKEVASDAWREALAQRREPLTASQVNELCGECNLDWHCGWAFDEEPNRYLELARAIEKHHGIGATTGEQQ